MERKALDELQGWLVRPRRRPLVLRGARQVGKTWLARELASQTDRTLLELNFERDPAAAALFESPDPQAVLRAVEVYLRRRIRPQDALFFLDEIQAAPEILAKLRWFAEELPEMPVIAAGSLLDFALTQPAFSIPVGRISYLHLEPMSFEEFLAAVGETALRDLILEADFEHAIAAPLHERLLGHVRDYLLVGGLPAAVGAWCAESSYLEVSRIQQDLVATFRDDFARYSGRIPLQRLDRVMMAVPRLLGCKFVYSRVDPDQRAAALGHSLDLLCRARLCHRVQASDCAGLPLAAGVRERAFKVIGLDVGLTSASLGLSPRSLQSLRDVTLVNEGGLAEQLAGQLLRCAELPFREPGLHYWSRHRPGSQAEIDYVIQHDSAIIPIEVKAGTTGTLKSLHFFMARRGLPLALRLDSRPPSLVDVSTRTTTGEAVRYRLLSLPLYLAGSVHRWLDLAAGRDGAVRPGPD